MSWRKSRGIQMTRYRSSLKILQGAAALTLVIAAAALADAQSLSGSMERRAATDEARVQTRRALELDRAGRYQEAVAAYKRASELAPNDPGLYNNLGNALANLG